MRASRWPWRAPLAGLLLALAAALLAGAAAGQPPPQPVSPELAAVEAQLRNLTGAVATTIARRFRFCVDHPLEDWNGAFNYSSDLSFVEQCLAETGDDLPGRLCTQAEIQFYFKSLYDRKGDPNIFLKTNLNCNLSSWVAGCEPGWSCAVGSERTPGDSTIPPRTVDCRPCCPGFFCPRGLTCMLPCPLGSYCPRATLNITTGLCDPYKYQLPPGNRSHTCGGADTWADFGSTGDVFCPAGYYCPSTTKKIPCSSGHYCRLGSTAETECIRKSSCKPNSKKENIAIVGASLVGALGVLLLVIYNCSGQFLSIRERRHAKSRETAAQMARELQQLRAREGWRAAKQIAKKHVGSVQSHLSRTFSRRKSFRQPDAARTAHQAAPEAPLVSSGRSRGLPDSAVFAVEDAGEISEVAVAPSVPVDASNGGEPVSYFDSGAGEEEAALKGKHRPTKTQIFRYAYGEIARQKVWEEEHKNLSFTGAIAMASERKRAAARPLLKLEFRELTLRLGKRQLLRRVTGELRPGRVAAVMGPSGAGKTTFLNAVAGKVAGYRMSGSVLVNGQQGSVRAYKRIIGFVPQDDVVHGNLTVEENLWFSAKCRLPANMARPEKVLIVERVIDSLDLQAVRTSLVGTVEKRGISGGQRKRVNVGLEMVMEPSLLILDEPTSGLDSSSSQLLLRALRHEALEGVNVCAVVHQPSYTLYNMFDDLILLAKGGLVVYNGPVKDAEEYFAALGVRVPGRVNPPDHYIDILEGIARPDSGVQGKHLPVHWMLHKGYDVPSDMQDDLREIGELNASVAPSASVSGAEHCVPGEAMGEARQALAEERDHLRHHLSASGDLSGRRTPGVLRQFKYFLGRVTKQRLREARLLAVDFLILCLAGICLGTIAKLNDESFGMAGYIYTIIAVSLLCKIAALRSFSLERLQYWRERESGMSSLAYFLARDTIDHFSTVVKPIVYLSMFYFFNNPRSTIAANYVVMLSLVYCVTGIGYTFAICFAPGSAQLWSALLPVVLTLLSTQSGTPGFLRNLCYPKWALEAFIIVNAKRYPGVWLITRCGLLFKSRFDIRHYNLCISVLFLYGLFFRILAFIFMILLKKR